MDKFALTQYITTSSCDDPVPKRISSIATGNVYMYVT